MHTRRHTWQDDQVAGAAAEGADGVRAAVEVLDRAAAEGADGVRAEAAPDRRARGAVRPRLNALHPSSCRQL